MVGVTADVITQAEVIVVKGRSYSSVIGVLIKRGKLVTHTEGRGYRAERSRERMPLEACAGEIDQILREQAYHSVFFFFFF